MSDTTRSRPCIDDDRIKNTESLYRHVHPTQLQSDAEAVHGVRPASRSFIDAEMSVDRKDLTSLKAILERKPETHVAEFTVEEIRGMGYKVWWDPQEDNQAHAIVCPKLTKRQARDLSLKQNIMALINPKSWPKNPAVG